MRELTSFYHCQQESAQNKGQLPDLEMGTKQKQKQKSTDTKPTKTQNVVFMQGRNKQTKQPKCGEIQSQIQHFEKSSLKIKMQLY